MDEGDNLTNDESNNDSRELNINSGHTENQVPAQLTNNALSDAMTSNNTEQDTDGDTDADIDIDLAVVMNLPTGVNLSSAGTSNSATSSRAATNITSPSQDALSAAIMDYTDWDPTTGNSEIGDDNSPTERSGPSHTDSSLDAKNPSKSDFFYNSTSFTLRTRREVAAIINEECVRGESHSDLDSVMDTLFHPGAPIDSPDHIEWVRWLIAGGRTTQEFVKIGKLILIKNSNLHLALCHKKKKKKKNTKNK